MMASSGRRPRRIATPAFALAGVGAAAAFLALVLPLLPRLDHDYDEGVYWLSLESMARGHRLFTEVFSSQPPFFLESMAPLYHLFGGGYQGGRLATLALAAVGIGAAFDAGRSLGGRWIGLFAAAALALDPLYLKSAVVLQADGPSVVWEIVAVALALRGVRAASRRRLWLLAAGAMVGVGVMTKLFAVAAIVPVGLLPLLVAGPGGVAVVAGGSGGDVPVPAGAWWRERLGLAAAGAAGLVVALAAIPLPNLLQGAGQAMIDQVVGFHLAAESATTGSFRDHVDLIAGTYAGGPLALLALTSLLALRGRRRGEALALLAWLAASVYLLMRQKPLWDHHVVLLVPPVALLAALGAAEIGGALRAMSGSGHATDATSGAPPAAYPGGPPSASTPLGAGAWPSILCAAAATLVLAVTVGIDAHRPPPGGDGASSAAIADSLKSGLAGGSLVVGDEPFAIGLAGDIAPPDLVDTSHVRINGGALTTARAEAAAAGADAVLEATGRLSSLPGFDSWLARRFHRVPAPAGARLWLR